PAPVRRPRVAPTDLGVSPRNPQKPRLPAGGRARPVPPRRSPSAHPLGHPRHGLPRRRPAALRARLPPSPHHPAILLLALNPGRRPGRSRRRDLRLAPPRPQPEPGDRLRPPPPTDTRSTNAALRNHTNNRCTSIRHLGGTVRPQRLGRPRTQPAQNRSRRRL